MYKKLLLVLASFGFLQLSYAVDLTGADTYYGKIGSVSVDFFNHVGVALEDGTTCNAKKVVVLQTDNTQYKDIYSSLIAAQVAQKEVHMYRVASNLSTFGTLSYCVIEEMALGLFPLWPVSN